MSQAALRAVRGGGAAGSRCGRRCVRAGPQGRARSQSASKARRAMLTRMLTRPLRHLPGHARRGGRLAAPWRPVPCDHSRHAGRRRRAHVGPLRLLACAAAGCPRCPPSPTFGRAWGRALRRPAAPAGAAADLEQDPAAAGWPRHRDAEHPLPTAAAAGTGAGEDVHERARRGAPTPFALRSHDAADAAPPAACTAIADFLESFKQQICPQGVQCIRAAHALMMEPSVAADTPGWPFRPGGALAVSHTLPAASDGPPLAVRLQRCTLASARGRSHLQAPTHG